MVTFSEYVKMAYAVADEKGISAQLRGPGTAEDNRAFMKELSRAYNENNHNEATMDQAREFLRENVQSR